VESRPRRGARRLESFGVLLKLGDQEKPALDLLLSRFEVTLWAPSRKGEMADCLVTKKNSTEIVGVVTFRSGNLVKAYRDWTPVDDEYEGLYNFIWLRNAVMHGRLLFAAYREFKQFSGMIEHLDAYSALA
jgi:hypothetical protein